jgi:hypothetical protein
MNANQDGVNNHDTQFPLSDESENEIGETVVINASFEGAGDKSVKIFCKIVCLLLQLSAYH